MNEISFYGTMIYFIIGLVLATYVDMKAGEMMPTYKFVSAIAFWPILLALIAWYKVKEWMNG